ncbi:hypothetical protein B0T17DRAFT_620092 [Bombardia bombarda]|uniref:Uncharacterized protein n=1 Tax=Bombardia bombarda TaxID=252184 RepID=A0AA39WH45_9PEZI|nr:hypothetical protein B0T17DRAFT_620092 [Bombardia bombarda]
MPSLFVPSRDSRHRRACFALYRALLRQAPRVPLPPNIAPALDPVNPITALIRARFRNNKIQTSPRLHAQILAFLRQHNADLLSRPTKPTPPSSAPLPDTIPLLKRIPHPEQPHSKPPTFVPTERPRPLSQIKGGVRKVPTLEMAQAFPFLRLSKPQSPALSRVIGQLVRRRFNRLELMTEYTEHVVPEYKEEDRWERLVGQQLVRHGLAAADVLNEPTYKATAERVVRHTQKQLNERLGVAKARGRALWKLVLEEKALAEEEAEERRGMEGGLIEHLSAKEIIDALSEFDRIPASPKDAVEMSPGGETGRDRGEEERQSTRQPRPAKRVPPGLRDDDDSFW